MMKPLTHAKKKTKEENAENQKEAEKSKILTVKDPKTEKDIKLFHLDFTAVVELSDGSEEMIMIELQKVDGEGDIFRFKEYIAENFIKKRKIEIIDPDTGDTKRIEIPYRLIPIFILNFKIENEINDLMIKTRRIKTGIFTNKEFDKHNKFIDHLSYDIYVAQLPYLNEIDKSAYQNDEYKSKLYALLKLFDQKSKQKDNDHRLRLVRKIFPGFLDRVIKRLQAADIDNPDLEKQMKAEDQYLRILKERDNKISFFKLKYKETAKELDKEKIINQEKDKELKYFKLQLAKTLKNSGKRTEEIQQQTKLSKEEIDKL